MKGGLFGSQNSSKTYAQNYSDWQTWNKSDPDKYPKYDENIYYYKKGSTNMRNKPEKANKPIPGSPNVTVATREPSSHLNPANKQPNPEKSPGRPFPENTKAIIDYSVHLPVPDAEKEVFTDYWFFLNNKKITPEGRAERLDPPNNQNSKDYPGGILQDEARFKYVRMSQEEKRKEITRMYDFLGIQFKFT
jgi:hypothetical protein